MTDWVLVGLRAGLLLLIAVIATATVTQHIVDPLALAVAGLSGYALWQLRSF